MDKQDVYIDLTDDEWYSLMKMAHQQDITLNQLVNNILEEHLKKISPENPNNTLD